MKSRSRPGAYCIALLVAISLAGCGGNPQAEMAIPVSAEQAAPVPAPQKLEAALDGLTLQLRWTPVTDPRLTGYRIFIDQAAAVEVPADATAHVAPAGAPGTVHIFQVQAVAGEEVSRPAAMNFSVPYPPRAPEKFVEPAPAPAQGQLSGPATQNSIGSAQANGVCAQVQQQVGIVASLMRDWENNLNVQGDMVEKLDPPAQTVAGLAGGVSGSIAAELVALSDQIKQLRQNFMGKGGVIPDGKQDGPRDYDTVKAKILAGVPSC